MRMILLSFALFMAGCRTPCIESATAVVNSEIGGNGISTTLNCGTQAHVSVQEAQDGIVIMCTCPDDKLSVLQ